MKKAVAYTATAILLGFAIMMVPLTLQNASLIPTPSNVPTESCKTMGNLPSKYGPAAKPWDLISSGLILVSGLIVAGGAYIILRKRMI